MFDVLIVEKICLSVSLNGVVDVAARGSQQVVLHSTRKKLLEKIILSGVMADY